jgi:hypothetical protein
MDNYTKTINLHVALLQAYLRIREGHVFEEIMSYEIREWGHWPW